VTYLSLFSGACGGDLGLQHLLGLRCAGYVEIDPYCQKLIRQRIADACSSDTASGNSRSHTHGTGIGYDANTGM
jgi:site-specific DNA-cytosine methylase